MPADLVDEADFSGSTAGTIGYVQRLKPARAMLATEYSMASNIADALPEVDFVGSGNMCS
ncbi:hypothetical protein [Cypionkella psychrotolerans]|uniref:hypothetical protein n=1 Tax=Cypionkella psychrotolerans TaxID=1678131 RepID=UPI000AD3C56F